MISRNAHFEALEACFLYQFGIVGIQTIMNNCIEIIIIMDIAIEKVATLIMPGFPKTGHII